MVLLSFEDKNKSKLNSLSLMWSWRILADFKMLYKEDLAGPPASLKELAWRCSCLLRWGSWESLLALFLSAKIRALSGRRRAGNNTSQALELHCFDGLRYTGFFVLPWFAWWNVTTDLYPTTAGPCANLTDLHLKVCRDWRWMACTYLT
jgi:hypothetical protein